MSGAMSMKLYPSSHKLDQYSAAHRLYGEVGLRIGINAQIQALSQTDGGIDGQWAFHEDGQIGYWAPEAAGPFTVNCLGSFTTLEAVDAKTLGIAFTIMAINHLVFDAYHEDNEQLCEQLAEWQEQLRSYAFEVGQFDGNAINTILD